jgi:surface antigen
MWRFTIALAALGVALLPVTAAAAPDDRGGAGLAVDQTVVVARQAQEVRALEAQVLSVTAERDQLYGQVMDLKGQVAALQGQLTATRGSAGIGARPVAAGPVAFSAPGANHFAFGYCTWYVANRRQVPWSGDAGQWGPNAAAMGFPEGLAPRVGAIMVTWESSIGHVAYVEAVYGDGSWEVSEMNYAGWNVVDRRTVRPGTIPLETFIY